MRWSISLKGQGWQLVGNVGARWRWTRKRKMASYHRPRYPQVCRRVPSWAPRAINSRAFRRILLVVPITRAMRNQGTRLVVIVTAGNQPPPIARSSSVLLVSCCSCTLANASFAFVASPWFHSFGFCRNRTRFGRYRNWPGFSPSRFSFVCLFVCLFVFLLTGARYGVLFLPSFYLPCCWCCCCCCYYLQDRCPAAKRLISTGAGHSERNIFFIFKKAIK